MTIAKTAGISKVRIFQLTPGALPSGTELWIAAVKVDKVD